MLKEDLAYLTDDGSSMAKDFTTRNPLKLWETARAACSWKQGPQLVKGNTSGVKVEDGTGFKVRRRLYTVYQRTSTGPASSR